MIIDFKTGEEIELVVDPNHALIKESGDCLHYHQIIIDEVGRTCTCSHCKKTIDVFTILMRLFHHYETRIDSRLAQIKEFDTREREKRERRDAKRRQPREALIKRRAESLERAAYNEYQAKLLTIRATKQRDAAGKLDAVLDGENGLQDSH